MSYFALDIKMSKSNDIHRRMAFGVFLVYKHHFNCVSRGSGLWYQYQEVIIWETKGKYVYLKWELSSHSDPDLGQGRIKIPNF